MSGSWALSVAANPLKRIIRFLRGALLIMQGFEGPGLTNSFISNQIFISLAVLRRSVQRLSEPISASPRLSARPTQLRSPKKYHSGSETVTTLCPIWPAQGANPRPSIPFSSLILAGAESIALPQSQSVIILPLFNDFCWAAKFFCPTPCFREFCAWYELAFLWALDCSCFFYKTFYDIIGP